MAGTKRADVVATFHRYYGRNPINRTDWDTVNWLTKKSPQEVEKLLAKDSPVTGGKLWSEYNKKNTVNDLVWRSKNGKTAKQELIDSRKKWLDGERRQYKNGIDPYAVAEELGYSRDDFSNDPGFESYWKNKTKEELVGGLKSRRDSDNSGRKITSNSTDSNDYEKWVDSQPISDAQKDILKNIDVDTKKVYTEKELEEKAKEFEIKAKEEIQPYYDDLRGRDMEDLKNKYSDIRNSALRYQQKDEKSYKELLDKTKQSLRARGMTFSGRSRQQLGAESAIGDKGVEGEIPQDRRYKWEDARAVWQERARDVGTDAERRYGSKTLYEQRDYLNPEGLPDPYNSGIRYNNKSYQSIYSPHKKDSKYGYISSNQADIEKDKARDIETRKQNRMKTLRY